eukprot:gnl/TRDRNA2_/TRDRNA2_83700_c0_seq1.p1 gnl/TRDRNA2_/TRDRNA2_83700_c0~~gnl/TRDRNA2_/TRDRNA2_83700_c0_seq1.p1  ORF type:complete len:354 (+),score=73.40 gnl/TRDRNA2_/TRDRNA2_83700_c0_seq1:79-1140(+)
MGRDERVEDEESDVKTLQKKLEQLSQRLELLNEYYLEVEAEASKQVERLKKSQLLTPEASDCEHGLHIVKLFHCVADAVAGNGVHSRPLAGTSLDSKIPTATDDPAASMTAKTESASKPVRPRPQVSTSMTAMPSCQPPEASASKSSSSTCLPDVPPLPKMKPESDGDANDMAAVETPTAANAARTAPAIGANLRERASSSSPASAAATASEAAAVGVELVSSSSSSEPESTAKKPENSAIEMDGLVLGRGSWAVAYVKARGPRRDSMRLLCNVGIVSARELADDNMVISSEHIEECILIATEMLYTWNLEKWQEEGAVAKQYFEARLTALYQRKLSEQKAVADEMDMVPCAG